MHLSDVADPARQAAALRAARRRKGFYLHLLPFTLVIAGLAALNLLLTPQHLWVPWVAAGWGFGLAIHGVVILLRDALVARDGRRRHAAGSFARET